MSIQWIACDVVTGKIVEELPDLRVNGTVGRILGAYTQANFTLPIPLPGYSNTPTIDWESATEPGRSMIVGIARDRPVWGGIIIRRRGGSGPSLALSAVTIEGYLDRRYIEDHSWANHDQTSVIAAGAVGDAQVEGIDLTLEAPASGILRERNYHTKDNKTVYAVLNELSNVVDGPEWTIDLEWSDGAQTGVDKIVRLAQRIGVASPQPDAVFETTAPSVFDTSGSASAEYAYDEDYTSAKGANHLVAYSSGQGDDQPFSAPARDEALLSSGWPRWEHRWQPSSSISDVSTLDSHAVRRLPNMRLGARTWEISARWSLYPLLGEHWWLGDDVAWDLIGPRHPNGTKGQARAIGWNLDPEADRIDLVLWTPGSEEDS